MSIVLIGDDSNMTTASPMRTVGGRYLLVSRIASGGMGDVWRATDELLGRDVAIKLLRSEFGNAESFRQRFRFEARAAASLSDPGIAAVFDYGEEVDGYENHVAYIVMELVEGESLDARLRREGHIAPSDVIDIVGQAARGLQAAHQRGIVHRDVKPANLLIRPDGVVKITDFGIARALDGAALTQTGTMLGTVQYMSPEQLNGRSATAASDIYALGVVAFCCLAGQTPFSREESMAVALAHLRDEVPLLPGHVPVELCALVYLMLEKDPTRRPASAGAVAAATHRIRDLTTTGPASVDTSIEDPRSPAEEQTVRIATRSRIDADALGSTVELQVPSDGYHTAVFRGPNPVHIQTPPRLKISRLLWAAAGAAALLALVLLWPSGSPLNAGMATIPDFHGLAAKVAVAKVKALGLQANTHLVDGNHPSGMVISQKPMAGAQVSRGSQVALEVASGFVSLNTASLLGQPYGQVAATITGLGLDPVEQASASALAPGTVISVAPSGRLKSGTSVTVDVATAPPPGPPGHGDGGKGPGKKKGG